ncbi:MAG: LysE family transporter [Anaerolineae bacterium]|nr:LysE family transporter [Anaerolineae bacterium]
MADHLFTTGLVLGFAIAAPVGPIGVLCIQRTLNLSQRHGLVSGLGAATADAVYGSMAAFGLALLTDFLLAQTDFLRVVGGVFLGYLGLKTFLAGITTDSVSNSAESLGGAYLSTFFLTLTNPMTILSFAAIFAGVGLAEAERSYLSAGLLVLGVFLGSGLWWLLLSFGVGLFRRRFDARMLRWVNKGAGVMIIGFGLAILWSWLSGFI